MADFHFWESIIFYIYVLKSIVIVYCIRYGFKVDKKEKPIFEAKEKIRKAEKEAKKKKAEEEKEKKKKEKERKKKEKME